MMLPFTVETQVLLAIAIPFVGALLIPLFHRWPNLRETVTLATADQARYRSLGPAAPRTRRQAA